MSTRIYRYCLAVAECSHFRRAAEACDVSQSTLSGQIKRLEDYLGLKIFVRLSRGVEITPAGTQILAQAKAIIEAEDEIRRIAILIKS